MKWPLIALLTLVSCDVFAMPAFTCESNQMKLAIRIEQQVVRKTAVVFDVEDGNERMVHNEYLIASGGAYNNLTTGGYVVCAEARGPSEIKVITALPYNLK